MLHQTFTMHSQINSDEEKHANCERGEARKQIKLQNASLPSNSQVFLTFSCFEMKNTTSGQRPEGTIGTFLWTSRTCSKYLEGTNSLALCVSKKGVTARRTDQIICHGK